MIRPLVLSLLLCTTAITAMAQSSTNTPIRFRVSGGLSTLWITNDNPAVSRIVANTEGELVAPDNPDDTPIGAAFDGQQIGYGIRGYADLDKQKRFRIPFGLDYHMLRGTQSVRSTSFTILAQNSLNITTAHLGFEYAFMEFPLAFARAYVAAELRGAFIGQSELQVRWTTILPDSISRREGVLPGKPSTFRLGGMARLGIEGELYYPVFLNTSIGYGVLNMVGRDSRSTASGGRGELLTPDNKNEAAEGYIHYVNFTFMIQVRL
ncbi:MAG: hypothetical protein MUC47_05990 [Candidatus Kapabacteria bacterium]|nr:hypothetical protein [Candidatus Kapabacteria bacterium]